MSDLTKRFSDGAKRALSTALSLAKEYGHSYIGSEHLLAGIATERDSTASRLLSQRGVTESELRRRIVGIVGTGIRSGVTTEDLTPPCRRILLRASLMIKGGRNAHIATEHLLIALLREECVGKRLAENCGADSGELLDILEELYGKGSSELQAVEVKKIPKSTPLLDRNAVNLTEKALLGGTDPVIGREKEEEQVIGILLRRTKNNPCLVGEAGVGKTAIVESVASRIAEGRVPEALLGKRIMSLEIASIVAGTKYRGQFEERIRSIIKELQKNPDVILFIDEIHTLVGAGSAAGSMDAANMLKPALARGEIQCIGATTLDEYRKNIEKDGALERRFQKVIVEPTTADETLLILKNIKDRYEEHHNVTYTDEAIEACVKFSERYITDRSFPDKAIDVLDEAGSRVHLINISVPKEIEEQEKLIDEAVMQKELAVKSQNYELAANHRDRANELTKQLDEMKKAWESQHNEHRQTVDEEEIARVVSMMSGIPVQRMAQTESARLMNMKGYNICQLY